MSVPQNYTDETWPLESHNDGGKVYSECFVGECMTGMVKIKEGFKISCVGYCKVPLQWSFYFCYGTNAIVNLY